MKIKQYIPPADSEEHRPSEKKYPMRRVNVAGDYEVVFCKDSGEEVACIFDSSGNRYRNVKRALLDAGYSVDFAEWDNEGKFIRENGTVEIKDWHPVPSPEVDPVQKKYPMWRTVLDVAGQFRTEFCDETGSEVVITIISQSPEMGEPFRIPGVKNALSLNGFETDFAEWTDRGEFVRFREEFVDREKCLDKKDTIQ